MFLRDSIYFIYAVYTKTLGNAHARTKINTLGNQIKINIFLNYNYHNNFIYGNNIPIKCLSCMFYYTKY